MLKGVCQDCGAERQWLHRHHVVYRVNGGRDEDGLVQICANCHEDRHGGPVGGLDRGRLANTPAAKAKKSASLKRAWQDPETRERWIESRRRSWTPERRARQAESARRWAAEHPEENEARKRRISETKRQRAAVNI